jgi:hypothetical protein
MLYGSDEIQMRRKEKDKRYRNLAYRRHQREYDYGEQLKSALKKRDVDSEKAQSFAGTQWIDYLGKSPVEFKKFIDNRAQIIADQERRLKKLLDHFEAYSEGDIPLTEYMKLLVKNRCSYYICFYNNDKMQKYHAYDEVEAIIDNELDDLDFREVSSKKEQIDRELIRSILEVEDIDSLDLPITKQHIVQNGTADLVNNIKMIRERETKLARKLVKHGFNYKYISYTLDVHRYVSGTDATITLNEVIFKLVKSYANILMKANSSLLQEPLNRLSPQMKMELLQKVHRKMQSVNGEEIEDHKYLFEQLDKMVELHESVSKVKTFGGIAENMRLGVNEMLNKLFRRVQLSHMLSPTLYRIFYNEFVRVPVHFVVEGSKKKKGQQIKHMKPTTLKRKRQEEIKDEESIAGRVQKRTRSVKRFC